MAKVLSGSNHCWSGTRFAPSLQWKNSSYLILSLPIINRILDRCKCCSLLKCPGRFGRTMAENVGTWRAPDNDQVDKFTRGLLLVAMGSTNGAKDLTRLVILTRVWCLLDWDLLPETKTYGETAGLPMSKDRYHVQVLARNVYGPRSGIVPSWIWPSSYASWGWSLYMDKEMHMWRNRNSAAQGFVSHPWDEGFHKHVVPEMCHIWGNTYPPISAWFRMPVRGNGRSWNCILMVNM